MSPCQGCGEQPDRCRCDGPRSPLGEDLAFGFHIEGDLDDDDMEDFYDEQ